MSGMCESGMNESMTGGLHIARHEGGWQNMIQLKYGFPTTQRKTPNPHHNTLHVSNSWFLNVMHISKGSQQFVWCCHHGGDGY